MPEFTNRTAGSRLAERLGVSPHIAWGYLAVVFFAVGDGMESGFLSPYLTSLGFSAGAITLMFTVYGAVAAVAAWLSGALAEALGPKRVMMTGFCIWIACGAAFLTFGLLQQNYALMLVTFGLRGMGTPMFLFGFLVWIATDTRAAIMGRAMSWYYFASALGSGVLGSYFAGLVIPLIGEFATLWTAFGFVVIGGLIAIIRLHDSHRPQGSLKEKLRTVVTSLNVILEYPKVGVAGIIRLINTLSFFAFVVFLSTHMVHTVGFTQQQWQIIWGSALTANMVSNLASGYFADWIGKINVVAWGGGIGCFVSVLGLYFIPTLMGPIFPLTIAIAVLYGFSLGAFVPLSALMPSLAPTRIAAAVAVLNLGGGASQFLGSLIAGLVTPFGTAATVIIIAALYLVGFGLTLSLRTSSLKVS